MEILESITVLVQLLTACLYGSEPVSDLQHAAAFARESTLGMRRKLLKWAFFNDGGVQRQEVEPLGCGWVPRVQRFLLPFARSAPTSAQKKTQTPYWKCVASWKVDVLWVAIAVPEVRKWKTVMLLVLHCQYSVQFHSLIKRHRHKVVQKKLYLFCVALIWYSKHKLHSDQLSSFRFLKQNNQESINQLF